MKEQTILVEITQHEAAAAYAAARTLLDLERLSLEKLTPIERASLKSISTKMDQIKRSYKESE